MKQGDEQDPSGRTPSGRFAPGVSGNPTGKRPRREVRNDGYANAFTGHGTSRDRRTVTRHNTVVVNDLQGMDLRRGNWLAARICELLPAEAFRRGYDLKLKDKETSEDVQGEIEDLGLNELVAEAGAMERACTGAAIFPVIDGATGDLSEPLDLDDDPRIGKVLAFHLLEPRELVPMSWYTDITNPKFRRPETYRFWPLSPGGSGLVEAALIHESRLAILPGIRVSAQNLPGQRLGWGDSALTRPAEVLADFGLSWGSASTILHNFSQRIIKYKGLAEILADADGEKLVEKRARVMDMMSNVLRALPLDAEDDLITQTISVAGLSDMLIQFAQLVAAATDHPLTVLFGMSPAGMNATGESDMRLWYDRVGKYQHRIRKIVEWLIRLLLLSADGPTSGEEPDVWSIEWKPLWTPSEKEVSETRKTDAETDDLNIKNLIYTADDAAKSRYGGDTYGSNITIDFKAREEQAKLDAQISAADAAAIRLPGQQPPPVDAKPDPAANDEAKPGAPRRVA